MQPFPYFSRAQLGIILLVAAVLFFIYGWRANFGRTPATLPAAARTPVFVEVAGNIPQPGVYAFPAPPTLPSVWRQAGGPEPPPPSDLTLASGSRVDITGAGAYRVGKMSGPQLLTLGLTLDLNTATAADLEALPGIGPSLARRIAEHRQAHGPFQKPEDLLAVPGIGEKKLDTLKSFVTIHEPREKHHNGE